RRPDEHAEGVANVVHEALQRRKRPHLAALFFERRDVAELTPSLVRSPRGVSAALGEFVLLHRKMKRELVVELSFEPPPQKYLAQTNPHGDEPMPNAHVVPSTRVTAVATRCQNSASRASSRRPRELNR